MTKAANADEVTSPADLDESGLLYWANVDEEEFDRYLLVLRSPPKQRGPVGRRGQVAGQHKVGRRKSKGMRED